MKHSKKLLTKIGKQVVENYPAIATEILNSFPAPLCKDLELIPFFFTEFCHYVELPEAQVKGPVYKAYITEYQKVFVSAMVVIYAEPYLFNQKLSSTIGQHPQGITRIISEVQFRYRKDKYFSEKVNLFIGTLQLSTIKTVTK